MAALALIGTSGWVYAHWAALFYPPDLPPGAYLPFYARHFTTVEVNFSFYRLPSYASFAAWRAATPARFIFAVKASRYLTHMKKLKDPSEPVGRLLASVAGLEEKLGPLLFQFPHTWRKNYTRLLSFLDCLPPRQRYTFEFRHASWLTEDVFAALAAREMALCIPDHPALPQALRLTAGFTYLRLHAGRFGVGYTEPELGRWAERVMDFLRQGVDVYVYFNNDAGGWAVQNARRLCQLVQERGAAIEKVGG